MKKIVLKKRIESHIFEKLIVFFMIIAGLSSVFIFMKALKEATLTLAVIEIMIIVVLILLIQTIILIRIFENTQK